MPDEQSFTITAAQLRAVMPGADQAHLDAALQPINNAMGKHGIDAAPKAAAFLGQLVVESQSLTHFEENLVYIHPERIQAVFGTKRFPTAASAEPYVRQDEKLANFVYAHVAGNNGGTDGWTFRGRGYIQLTGRTNYRDVGYENNPDALLQPAGAADSAAAFWAKHGLNEASSQWLDRPSYDDKVTAKVNHAKLEADHRWAGYQRARQAFGA